MKAASQIPLDFETRPALGREDFLIGPGNKDAVAWIDRWPEWPAPALILTGPAASGKTHMGAVWRDRTGAESVRPDRLLSETPEEFARAGRNLLLDGLDPWLGDRAAETALFHLYNIFKEEGRTILITMRMAPSHVEFALPDLASRLRAAPVAAVHPPDERLLASVLIKLFSDRQLIVGNDVIRYVLPRMERSFAAARDIVESADRLALSQKRPISVPLLREILAGMQGE
ncbi:MAG: DNA replication protein [Alphaproteobacteria bacterium]|nr:DNA replication protein [Alphaproteobacteria bacterium]